MELEIRQVRQEDADTIARIYAPYVTDSAVSFEEQPPDADEMTKRIDAILQKYPYLVAAENNQVIGYAYASEHRTRSAYRWCVETTVYVNSTHHRRGVGRSLYRTLFPMLAKQNFINAYAGIKLPNPASVAIHESLGFKLVGIYPTIGFKQAAWHDVGWWQKQLQPLPTYPPEPIPWPKIAELQSVWH